MKKDQAWNENNLKNNYKLDIKNAEECITISPAKEFFLISTYLYMQIHA